MTSSIPFVSRRQVLQWGPAVFASALATGVRAQGGPWSAKLAADDGASTVWQRADRRNLALPDWGPYSDHLNGISHITDAVRGLRMDFALAPAVLRRETLVPYAEMGLAMQPVRADPELGYSAWDYSLASGIDVRLEWLVLNGSGGLLRASVTSRASDTLPVLLNWVARLAPPTHPPRIHNDEGSGISHTAQKGNPTQPADIALPAGALWVNALHYDHFDWAVGRFDDHLVTDGRRRGEIFEDGFIDTTGIGQGFGKTSGDHVQWRFRLAQPLHDSVVRFRFRMVAGMSRFKARGLNTGDVVFTAGDQTGASFQTLDIPVGALTAGEHALSLTACGGQPIEMNGFMVAEKADLAAISITPHAWKLAPERTDDVAAGKTRLNFPEESTTGYALAWTGGTAFLHSARTDDLRTLEAALNDPSLFAMDRVPAGTGPGHVTIAAPDITYIHPGETVVRDCLVAAGSEPDLDTTLQDLGRLDLDALLAAARARHTVAMPYGESAERLLATLATNMLFPIWTGGRWVRNYCPGREWSSVYTWDSGFTGLGLAGRAPRLATALLDTYLSPVEDEQAAFLHHGTPLPTQFYLFQDLWNRNGSLDFARTRYPRLARYLRFLLGRETGSTCRNLKSGLIRTYDYFYNTGGMDDYPAQMAVHRQNMAGQVAPVISSAHAIRCARLLCQVAEAIGATRDLAEWRADIASLGDALQGHSWDQASGYFAYVVHDDNGAPTGKWRSAAGENYNMGLDGVSPLVSDICSPAQAQTLIDNLMTPGRLWTPSGITAVDRRASYYDKAGYWNGTVWMPHQWFMWKALLDYGEGDKAWMIAKTALDVYGAEIARSGRTYEHFDADTGIGGGWHPFGALSSPVRQWFEACCQPGTLSVGLNTRIVSQLWDGTRGLRARLEISGARPVTVLAVFGQMPARASWRGKTVDATMRTSACAELVLDPGRGDLVIS